MDTALPRTRLKLPADPLARFGGLSRRKGKESVGGGEDEGSGTERDEREKCASTDFP